MSYTGIMDRQTGDRHTREMGVESFTEGGSEIKTRLGRKVVRTS